MNVLLLCDLHADRPWVRDRLSGLKKAALQYEHNVYIRDIYEAFGSEISANLREHAGREQRLLFSNIQRAEKAFLKELEKYDVRTIVFATADNYREFLTLDFLMQLKSRGYNLVGFLGDDEFNHPQYQYLAAVFDQFVVYVAEYKKYYEEITGNTGYLLLNSCHIEDLATVIKKPNYKFDTVLIGGPILARVNVLRRLKNEGFTVAIYGPETWKHIPDLKENYQGFVSSANFDQRLSEGRIILSMLEDHLTGRLHMNTKIWESARAGCFTIATNYEPLFSNYGFVEGINIVTYRNEVDLYSKFKYYLKNDAEREKIRQNFLHKVYNELDYQVLYLNFFQSLQSHICTNKITNYVAAHRKIPHVCKKYDGLYYNIVNSNRPVKQFFPFINPNSIIHFNLQRYSPFFRYTYFLLHWNRYHHVNLYMQISGKRRATSRINAVIHAIKYNCIKPFYRKYIMPIKKRRRNA